MVKETFIMVRVDSPEKTRIEEAARSTGRSLSRFVLDATIRAVADVEAERRKFKRSKVKRGHLPTYFKACCQTASAGGTEGYRWVGYSLLGHLEDECPDEFEVDEWLQLLDELGELLSMDDSDREVVAWLNNYLPRFVALVPQRRRDAFISGMRECFEEQGGWSNAQC